MHTHAIILNGKCAYACVCVPHGITDCESIIVKKNMKGNTTPYSQNIYRSTDQAIHLYLSGLFSFQNDNDQ